MTQTSLKIPKKGRDKKAVLQTMRAYRKDDADYKAGKTWSLVYYLGEEHTEFLKDAYNLYFSENALNPMAFKSLKRFESEVIQMTAAMLNGDCGVVGTMTSGGTESCLLAVKTYRDLARDKRPWIIRPEIIVPESIHVAFEKAAEYFQVKMVHAPLDKNYRVDVPAVRRLCNWKTILIVGSAPCYPYGVVDPIPALGALAVEKNIPLHVDGCLGGFLLPFVEKLGYDLPAFDFRVPGVSSISADVHKYGFSAKGVSTILYRNMGLLKYQFFVYENWPGGVFISPALLGTRPGGAIAAAWSAINALGEAGYLDNARTIMKTAQKLRDGINALADLEVIGQPDMSVMAFVSKSKSVNIFAVADQLEKKGWHIDRQQKPDSLHLMVTPYHQTVAGQYLSDLKGAVAYVKTHPEEAEKGTAPMYGLISAIPFRGLVKKNLLKIMTEMYGPESKMPGDESEPADDLATKLGLLFLKIRNRLGI